MRSRSLWLVAAMACAFAAHAADPPPKPKTLTPPPAIGARDPEAPPEGKGPGGLDFGAWRSMQPAAASSAFAVAVAELTPERKGPALRAALEANGFKCTAPDRSGVRYTCARSALEQACGYDWIVEVRPDLAQPRATFEAACLGPRASIR